MADEFTKAALYWIRTFNRKAKEKIWMEKLIELLNEYDPYIASDGEHRDNLWYFIYKWWSAIFPKEVWMLQIISKEYWFIKWLVENDKIDLVKVYENLTNYEIEIRIRAVKELLENNEEDTIAYLKLLMLLSIQDEPIRFLCEIIK